MKLTLEATAPESLVVSLVEAKAYIRVESTLEDDLITELIKAATSRIESECFRLLTPHTVTALYANPRLTGDDLFLLTSFIDPDGVHAGIALSKSPIVEIDTVSTISSTGVAVELDAEDWYYNATLGAIQWATNGIYYQSDSDLPYLEVVYSAGYGFSEDDVPVSLVPSDIKMAIKIVLADMYECRDSEVIYLPSKASMLLAKYRAPQYAG